MTRERVPSLLVTTLGLAVIGFSTLAHGSLALLLYNPSDSAPRGFYWRNPFGSYRVGSYTFARLPIAPAALAARRGYLPANVFLLKPIAAIQGDVVCVRNGHVFINGQPAARLLLKDGQHRPLQPWLGCRTIAVDEVFLLSPSSPASFDGRADHRNTRVRFSSEKRVQLGRFVIRESTDLK